MQGRDEWLQFLSGIDVKNLYIGGVTALSHSMDFDSYVNGNEINSYVSILFIVHSFGIEKKELLVVGKDIFLSAKDDFQIKSLPVTYMLSDKQQINYYAIKWYLEKWDSELRTDERNVVLIMDIPSTVALNCDNIKVISSTNMEFIKKSVQKVEHCFKNNYRRLQISKKMLYGKNDMKLIDQLQVMSTAWYDVSSAYIHRLFFSAEEGALFYNMQDIDSVESLSQWCKACHIPLAQEQHSKSLDTFVDFDGHLPSIDWGAVDVLQNVNEILSQSNLQPASSIQAYQAIKRLISYLQGENVEISIVKNVKLLENHIEYGALVEMHQIIATTNEHSQ